MKTPKRQIDDYITHQIYIEGVKRKQQSQLAHFLSKFSAHLKQQIAAESLETDVTKKRIDALLVDVRKNWRKLFEVYYGDLSLFMRDLVAMELEFSAKYLDLSMGDQENIFKTMGFHVEQVYTAAANTPTSIRANNYAGMLVDKMIDKWAKTEIVNVINTIRLDYVQGKSMREIAGDVIGTSKNNYKDGLVETSLRHGKAVVATVIQHLASTTRFIIFEKTEGVIEYQWVSTLDLRTSAPCRSLDGAVFKMGKGPIPPVHIACRSAIIPIFDRRKYPDLSEDRTRAAKEGPEKATKTYYEWLSEQSNEHQDKVLGPTLAKVFRDKDMTVEKFQRLNIGRNFQPLTIEEMKAKNPELFDLKRS